MKPIITIFLIHLIALSLTKNAAGSERNVHKTFYAGADGKLYVAKSLPLYFHVSTSPQATENVHLLSGSASKELINPAHLREGLNLLKIPSAISQANSAASAEAMFELYVDGTAPVTNTIFSGAPSVQYKSRPCYGQSLRVALTSQDQLAGVADIHVSRDNEAFDLYDPARLDFTASGAHTVAFYAVDHVGNVEEKHTDSFYVDVLAPVSDFKLQGIYSRDALAANVTIVLNSTDNLAGLEHQFYKFDDSLLVEYRRPVSVAGLCEGSHTISYLASDRVQNREEPKRWTFFVDKTPPAAEVAAMGRSYSINGITYIANNSEISISARDNRSGVDLIIVSVDDQEDVRYSGPFPLPEKSGLHRIKYRLIDVVQNQSNTLYASFYMDITPPSTSHKFEGTVSRTEDQVIINSATRISLSSTDMESGVLDIYYRINGGREQKYGKEFSLPGDGIYTLSYYAVDHVGNREEAAEGTIRVDNSSHKEPVIARTAMEAKQWFWGDDNLAIGATSEPFYLLLSDNPQKGGHTFLLGSLRDSLLTLDQSGLNTLRVDLGGNAAEFALQIDGNAPASTVQLTNAVRYEKDGQTLYGPGLMLNVLGTDSPVPYVSGLGKVFISIDGQEYAAFVRPLEVFYREKRYSVSYYAVDHAGNSEKVNQLDFSCDLTPPRTEYKISGSFFGNTLSHQSSIRLTANDQMSGVQKLAYSLDRQTEQAAGSEEKQVDLSALADGKHVLEFYAVDQVGNREPVNTFEFLFYSTLPNIGQDIAGAYSRSGNTSYITSRSKVLLSGFAKDVELKEICYQINSGPWQTYKDGISAPFNSGGFGLDYYSIDVVGNKSKLTHMNLFVDDIPPNSNHSFSGPQLIKNTIVYISEKTKLVLSAADNAAGVESIQYSLDGGPYNRYASPPAFDRFGRHTLRYRAIDHVKNSEQLKNVQFSVDNAAPRLDISYSSQPETVRRDGTRVYSKEIIIYVAASDDDAGVDEIAYQLNGEEERLYRSPLQGFDKGQESVVKIIARDRVGNTAIEVCKIAIKP
jgi:hypothetical protein